MGNQNSSMKKDKETADMKIESVIDNIATKYITQASFNDLMNLNKKEYCNKLVILTSKIIKKRLNNMEIDFLDQRTKKGVEINKMAKGNVLYLDRNDLNKLDVTNSVRKRRMCIGIAKFYIKVAHLFAAISMTINPEYTYTDQMGNQVTVPLGKKRNIPSNLKTKYSTVNLCSRRIKALMTRQNTENGIVIKVKNCDMNKKMDGSGKSLQEEIGIPELELLYFDKYDFDTGKYVGMTESSKKEYNEDLKKFYKAFTGRKMPKEIKKFSEIPLMDFHNQDLCRDRNSPWHDSYKGRSTERLFVKYAKHVKDMITKSKAREKSLLSIIKQMFSYWLDPKKQEKVLTINPNLTEKLLQKLIKDARKIIIDLYISCETDFQKGLGLFEAIVKAKMMSTAQRRIANFEKKADELQDEPIEEKKAPVEREEKMPPVEVESGPAVDTTEEKIPPVMEGESSLPVGSAEEKMPVAEKSPDSIQVEDNTIVPDDESKEQVQIGGKRKTRKRKKNRKRKTRKKR